MNFLFLIGFYFNFLKKYLRFILILKNEFFLYINNKDLSNFSLLVKNSLLFQQNSLLDIVGLDFLYKYYSYISDNRFKLVYVLNSYFYNHRIKVITSLLIDELFINSLCLLYNSANWLEREVFDFFGIFFIDHPDLRRILTDYGFNGYPLRKNFPLSGFLEVKYSFNKKKINSSNILIMQEFRNYSNEISWSLN